MRCPCRKKSESPTYAECCEPYHAGLRPAPTPEALMRSRYCAFVLENASYILATWHPSTRPARMEFDPGQEWQLLRVLAANEAGDRATVEFTARSLVDGRPHVLHEISNFVRDGDRWLYVDGVIRS